MELKTAKKLAASILKVGVGRVYIKPTDSQKVSEAMTKDDLRALIGERIIKKRFSEEQSRGRARELHKKQKKGRRRGKGKRTGGKAARTNPKEAWIGRVRAQRAMLREVVKENPEAKKKYREVYNKIRGNYFKGKKYVKEYLMEGKN